MPDAPTCPLPRSKVIDLYFLEHRAKLLDIAAFLDRLDRAADDLPHEDYRVAALRSALAEVQSLQPGRAARLLQMWSDPTAEPIPAAHTKGASGAYDAGAAR